MIEHLQRLQWHRHEMPPARLATLEQALQTVGHPSRRSYRCWPPFSLPVPEQYPSLALSPQRQKQKTQEALVAWLLAETATAGAGGVGTCTGPTRLPWNCSI